MRLAPQRLLRLSWVLLVNTSVIAVFVSSIWLDLRPFDSVTKLLWTLIDLAAIACSVIGVVAEMRLWQRAKLINTAVPSIVAVWLVLNFVVAIRAPQVCGFEGFLLVFALVPLAVAGVTLLLYFVLDVEPNNGTITLGLS